MLEHLNQEAIRPARVVVIGAHGFVGDAIARRLEADGAVVSRITRREVDLTAPGAAERLADLLRPGDALVAAAAIAPCRTGEMLRDNMTLALTIASAATLVPPAHFVNVSSDAVYADSPVPLTEQSVTAPSTLHGAMHLARELLFRSEIRAPLVTLRPTLVYGARDPHNGYGPNRFRRLAAGGDPIVLFGEGEERRDHVLVDDVAELAARVLYRRSVGVLNVATGSVASFREIAELVIGLSGSSVPLKTSARSGPMPHNGYRPFDIATCEQAFTGFSFTPLSVGLARAQRDEAESASAIGSEGRSSGAGG